MSFFPEPYTNKIKIEVDSDLSIYATKYDLKMQQVLKHYNLLNKMIYLI